MDNKQYDLIVIGAGAGGLTSAFTALGFGKKVLLIEKAKPGGECTWSGCVPSKGLINIAKEVYAARKYTDVKIDTSDVMSRVRDVIEHVYEEETPEVLQEAGADYVNGAAKFINATTVEAAGAQYTAKRFIIATGSSPFVAPIPGLDSVDYLTNESFFELEKLPESIIVLGGGAIGVELAQAMNRLGVEVKLVEMMPDIMFREEPEFATMLRQKVGGEGVEFYVGAKATKVAKNDGNVCVTVEQGEQSLELKAQTLLVALGRKANTDGIGFENIGVKLERGIVVDKNMQTSVNGIYACGDVTGPYQFSHMANYQGKIAAMNALLPINRKTNYKHTAWTTFTEPEFARAGLTEKEAREQFGDKIRVYEYDFNKLDRAKTKAGDNGKIKLVCDTKSRVLGCHIIGSRAGELICEVQAIKTLGLPFSKLQGVIHPYPTYADSLRQLAQQVYIDGIFKHPVIAFFIGLKNKFS